MIGIHTPGNGPSLNEYRDFAQRHSSGMKVALPFDNIPS
jgi:hypothetical protein